MRQAGFLILFLASIASLVAGSDPDNYFTNPADNSGINPVFTLGDKLVVSWKTTLDVFNVSIWQQSLVETGAASQGNIYSKIHSSDKVTNFTWVVQVYGFDLSYSNEFFLWVNPDEKGGFVSTYFNITEPTSTTSTTSSSTSTSASASTKTLNAAATPSSPSSASPSSSSDSDSQSSELTLTGKIAIGVGAGVGLPILCALGALLYLKTRKSDNKIEKTISPPEPMPPWMVMQNQHAQISSPKEVHGSSLKASFAELPNQPYR
ncbi:hypothetical protein N7536_000531 [Penicillium majusculum]|uniref:Mid2 domain-containing protein n=1 Tax=Penicillium solitum TaxID=60172 RepID=A0A1V6QH55_9EURO|nr:uncharacterized protein PENSOL_c071G10375 [Penicillium solitum]KAJ5704842.1 hypothetical protein N7536_000531 [Penicillium majusculum]OQD88535.1 hypothetical protein PENSOL_c071G10375 [Penicillium solitum]